MYCTWSGDLSLQGREEEETEGRVQASTVSSWEEADLAKNPLLIPDPNGSYVPKLYMLPSSH